MSAYRQILMARDSTDAAPCDHVVTKRVIRLSVGQQAQIVADYRQGRSMAFIASELGLQRSTIRSVLDRLGTERRAPVVMTTEEIDRAITLYEAGESLKSIEQVLGFHAETIRLQLLRRGVLMRSRSGRTFQAP